MTDPADSEPAGPAAPPPTPAAPAAPPSAQAPPPGDALGEQLLKGPAWWLARKNVGPGVLAWVAVGLGVVATFALMVDHPGLAGLLGLLAVLAGELARVPPPGAREAEAVSRAVVLLADLVLGAAFVVTAAADDAGIRVLLGLVVLGILAWLPYLKALGGKERLPPGAGLWRRPERLGVLMLGPLLGHPVIAQLLVLTVGVFDAWLRLTRLAPQGKERPGPSFLAPLLTADGTLQPLVRWGSLALAFLLLLVLPRPEGWRF